MDSLVVTVASILAAELMGGPWAFGSDAVHSEAWLFGPGRTTALICLLIVVLVNIPFWVLVSSLVAFHSYLVWADTTTYDFLTGKASKRRELAQRESARITAHAGKGDRGDGSGDANPAIQVGHSDNHDETSSVSSIVRTAVYNHGQPTLVKSLSSVVVDSNVASRSDVQQMAPTQDVEAGLEGRLSQRVSSDPCDKKFRAVEKAIQSPSLCIVDNQRLEHQA